MARQPERSQFDKGFYRYALGQGIGFGQGDEAEAYLRSKISGRPYEESLDRVRREMAQTHPTPVSYTHLTLPTKRIV